MEPGTVVEKDSAATLEVSLACLGCQECVTVESGTVERRTMAEKDSEATLGLSLAYLGCQECVTVEFAGWRDFLGVLDIGSLVPWYRCKEERRRLGTCLSAAWEERIPSVAAGMTVGCCKEVLRLRDICLWVELLESSLLVVCCPAERILEESSWVENSWVESSWVGNIWVGSNQVERGCLVVGHGTKGVTSQTLSRASML